MSKPRIIVLGLAGILLPMALALTAFVISSNVGAAADSPAVTQIKQQDAQIVESSGKGKKQDDKGGRCSEAEHKNDPECAATPSASPSSEGPGGATPTPSPTDDHGGSNSGSDNSGKGSSGSGGSGSGGGGGDDGASSNPDNSGKGSSGSGGSGSGGGGGDD